ncbi:ras-related protein Rab-6B isoform X4 [Mus musculus]|uniref:ras-related protein Rab-6B isoform X4 n=1 Tax=Mus musculus TaxID=10090 RepID=UPI0003D75E05|nr:ras-related protein Rab-6B isoform X4 [Mus musculus]|eukprot:XP_017168890.1 PREDICTED: ras-related protein Rab-6B isoform X3 [Mus musculus]
MLNHHPWVHPHPAEASLGARDALDASAMAATPGSEAFSSAPCSSTSGAKVGKTSLITRFMYDSFDNTYQFLFHSAMGGLKSYITWTPEGLPTGKDRRLWVRQRVYVALGH